MIKFVEILQERNIPITGVLHIGAHECQEESEYFRLGLTRENIIWVEANSHICKRALQPGRLIYNLLISDKDGEEKTFIFTNNEQSSSMLEL